MKAVISNISETNPFPGPYVRHKVLEKHIGLIIGKNGENIKNLHQKTSCYIFIPKECGLGEDFRILEISGDESNINECIRDIENLISISSNNKNSVDNENYFPVDFNYLNKHTQYMQQQHGMNTISLSKIFFY
jgi:rRNA processing protein Krr1/Pno1